MGLIASLRFEKDADVNEASNFFDTTVDNNKIINIFKKKLPSLYGLNIFLDLNIDKAPRLSIRIVIWILPSDTQYLSTQ